MTSCDKAALKGGILDRENEEALAAALACSGSPEEVRQSMTALLCALAELFRSRGAAIPWQLRLLIGGLEDLDRGTPSDFLRPSNRPQSRAPDQAKDWEARATLVLAVEILTKLGMPATDAEKPVSRDVGCNVPISGQDRRLDRALLNWKREFSRKTSQVPRDGEHWAILAEGRVHLKTCIGLEREARLNQLYEGTLRPALQPAAHGGRRLAHAAV